jgi:hypothetical protein
MTREPREKLEVTEKSAREVFLGGGDRLAAAVGADSAHFRAADGDFDASVARDLFLQLLVQLAFHLADFATTHAGNVDMIARAVAFVEMAVAAQVEQIELVDQAVALQQVNRAIDRHASDFRIDFLGAIEDFTGVKMAARGFHHLKQNAALACEANPASGELVLEVARRFVNVDAFAGRDAMDGGGVHGFQSRIIAERVKSSGGEQVAACNLKVQI